MTRPIKSISWLGCIALLLLTCAGAAAAAHHAKLDGATVIPAEVHPGDAAVVEVTITVDAGLHAQSHKPLDENLIPFTAKLISTDDASVTIGQPQYPDAEIKTYPALGKLSVYTGTVTIRFPIQVSTSAAAGTVHLTGQLGLQACNADSCFPPEKIAFASDVKIVAAAASQPATLPPGTRPATRAATTLPTTLPADVQAATRPAATQPVAAGPTPGDHVTAIAQSPLAAPAEADTILGISLGKNAYVAAFFCALLVGILFNAMPCVIPVLPLKAIGFYEVSQHNRGRCAALGATFSAGIISIFVLLALFVLVLHKIQWGGLFSNPWSLGAIVILLVVLAAGTFGLFDFALPSGIYRITPRHDTYTGNYLFGMLTAVLSTPCTFGMFVAILAWAALQPTWVGALLLVQVGVGMALPYMLLSLFPEVARNMPRGGPWANLIKQMMAFLLLATAGYFAEPLLEKFMTTSAAWWSVFGIIAAGAVYLAVRSFTLSPRWMPRAVATLIALVMVAAAGYTARQLTIVPFAWRDYTVADFAQARASGKPVLVEFTASWCGNCHYLEAFVLHKRAVILAVHDRGVVMFKADMTNNENAPAAPLLDKLSPDEAIPLTAIYPAQGTEPILLKGIYRTNDLVEAIDKARR